MFEVGPRSDSEIEAATRAVDQLAVQAGVVPDFEAAQNILAPPTAFMPSFDIGRSTANTVEAVRGERLPNGADAYTALVQVARNEVNTKQDDLALANLAHAVLAEIARRRGVAIEVTVRSQE